MNLLDLLAYPACKASVTKQDDLLHCTGCRRTYPWINGVPIMLLDPADARLSARTAR
jgi:uncharacterized protein YbaR (Trm112 family)